MLLDRLQSLGHKSLSSVQRLGRGHIFLFQVLPAMQGMLFRPSLLIRQMYSVGVNTLLIIGVAGLFVGMVLALQAYNALVDFGAEIGLMKATEQLSGMEMMAVNPIERVIAPRFLAGFVSVPLLTAIFSAVGVVGGYLVAVELLGLDAGAFWSQAVARVDLYQDLANGMIKSAVFGFVVVWIAVFEGYDCVPTSEGLGRATTRTVVHSSLAVLGLNFVLTALMFND